MDHGLTCLFTITWWEEAQVRQTSVQSSQASVITTTNTKACKPHKLWDRRNMWKVCNHEYHCWVTLHVSNDGSQNYNKTLAMLDFETHSHAKWWILLRCNTTNSSKQHKMNNEVRVSVVLLASPHLLNGLMSKASGCVIAWRHRPRHLCLIATALAGAVKHLRIRDTNPTNFTTKLCSFCYYHY